MTIHQGDQYAIPIKIKSGNDVITPENCTDVRIKVSDVLLEYSKGEIIFNSQENTWLFPLTENMSFDYNNSINVQIAVKFGNDFIYSPLQRIDVGLSVITEHWE